MSLEKNDSCTFAILKTMKWTYFIGIRKKKSGLEFYELLPCDRYVIK